MKLKYKMTLVFLFLYSVALITINYLVTQNTYTNMLESEIQGQLNIEETLHLNLTFSLLYNSEEIDSVKSFKKFADNFCNSFGNNNLMISISDLRDISITSNEVPTLDLSLSELKKLRSLDSSYILKHIDGSFYIFIYRKFDYMDHSYFLRTTRDISFIDHISKKNSSIFFNVSLIVSIFIVSLTLFFSHILSKPIWNLICTIKNISKGNFSDRISLSDKNSSDETYVLSNQFNEMIGIIEEKISSLETENLRKEAFINNLSHELRTPLTSIIGFSELLKNLPYNEKDYNKSLNYINSEGKRLLDISNLLLRLARIKEDKIEMCSNKSISVLHDIKEVANVKYRDSSVKISIDPSSKDYQFNMNPDLIKLCIHNLIENGVNASEPNSSIIIGTCIYNDRCCFFVKDQGIGINTEDIKFIFDPFYRADKSRSRSNGSTGLGLSICSEVAEIHSGAIFVDSTPGEGSTFYIALN